jgi:hypothetical protein
MLHLALPIFLEKPQAVGIRGVSRGKHLLHSLRRLEDVFRDFDVEEDPLDRCDESEADIENPKLPEEKGGD